MDLRTALWTAFWGLCPIPGARTYSRLAFREVSAWVQRCHNYHKEQLPCQPRSCTVFPSKTACATALLRRFHPGMAANRKLGCLSIFLFVVLCASVLVNFFLAAAAFQRFEGGRGEVEYRPRFTEMILERGSRVSTNKIAVISLRGLISSAI